MYTIRQQQHCSIAALQQPDSVCLLQARIQASTDTIIKGGLLPLQPIVFHEDPVIAGAYWDARKVSLEHQLALRQVVARAAPASFTSTRACSTSPADARAAAVRLERKLGEASR
jgi:hypothetical protein